MLVRITRWSLILAPVVAGVLVLVLGTAGSISTLFGVFLIGIAPIIWMWNWFVRMAFEEEQQKETPPPAEPPRDEARPPVPHEHGSVHHHPERRLSRHPRRRS
jgi:hypothetical protein